MTEPTNGVPADIAHSAAALQPAGMRPEGWYDAAGLEPSSEAYAGNVASGARTTNYDIGKTVQRDLTITDIGESEPLSTSRLHVSGWGCSPPCQ
jgi:hypothetical protein